MLARLRNVLGRVTTSGRFVPEIDGLRFLAILGVFVFHLDGLLAALGLRTDDGASRFVVKLAEQGHYGVQLFFLISGFILALPFAGHHLLGRPAVGLRGYLMRRLTRLEPPYLLTLLALYLMLVITRRATAGELGPHLAASAAYLHNIVYRGPSRVNGVAWSLEIEVQFYLLVPLLTRVFTVQRAVLRRGIVVLAMIALALYQRVTPVTALPAFTIVFFLQYFLAGVLVADLYLVDWNEAPQKSAAFDALGVAAGATLALVCARDLEVRLTFPFLAIAFVVGVFRGRALSRLFSLPLLTVVGGMCYSIYLIHYQVLSLVARRTASLKLGHAYLPNLLLQTVLAGAAVLLVSATLFLLIEKPCMARDWPRRARNSLASLLGARPAVGGGS